MHFFVLFFLSSVGFAAEDVSQTFVVTAERASPVGLGQAMSSSYIIDDAEIRRKGYHHVHEALQAIPGVDVVATSRGQTASIFIRGAKSEQTLVLVDGMELNDPTDPGRGIDLAQFPIDSIERIEVVRGAQSVLFAGMGGVINIVTKAGRSKEPQAYVEAEAGSFGTRRGEIGLSGVSASELAYHFSASGFASDGISASATGTERDGAGNVAFTSKLSKPIGEAGKVEGSLRYFSSRNELDVVPADTANHTSSQQNTVVRVQGSWRQGSWEPILGIGGRFIDRNAIDLGSTPNTRFLSNGDIFKTDFQNRITLGESQRVTVTGAWEREHAKVFSDYTGALQVMNNSAHLTTLLAQYDLVQDWGPYASVGVRGDYHSSFFFRPTYRAAAGYGLEATRTIFRGAVGTGFRAPSLYQLFGEFGNSGLKAEESLSVDAGVEQAIIEKRLSLLLTYFRRTDRELIDFDFASNRYLNVAKAKSEGAEVSVSALPLETLRVTSNYTFTESRDEITGLPLLRRPRHKVTTSFLLTAGALETTLEHRLVGPRTDVDAALFTRKEVPAYNVFNASGSYLVQEGTKVFLRLENLLNSRYQVIDGYSTPGLSFFGGIRQEL